MNGSRPTRPRKQRGALIVALMAGIAIMMILSTVAVQAWSDILRRDQEAEMMFRAQDIVRAIKRYQADQGKLPTEFKALMEPGNKNQYFLRQLWKDPLVKGGQWVFLYANPAGGIFDPTVTPPPQAGDAPKESLLQSVFGGNERLKTPLIGKAGDGSTEGPGLPIAGVKSRCTDHPFRIYHDKNEYKEWLFSIFDLDPRLQGMQGTQPANPQGQANPSGNPSSFVPVTH